jgi:hypothetical protein
LENKRGELLKRVVCLRHLTIIFPTFSEFFLTPFSAAGEFFAPVQFSIETFPREVDLWLP